jgi:gluconate 2-dehydrogenase subunit 3-like protein
MANQSPDRRQVLTLLSKVAAVSQFSGFSRWIYAAEHTHEDHVQPRPAHYKLQFFTPDEYKTVDQVTELIIPKDDSPGARDAGVGEFIDFMVAHDEDLQYRFRTGVTWLNAFAIENHGRDFPALSPDQQETLLARLAFQSKQSPTEVQGQQFFKLIREYTVMGYYTSRVGLEQLEYPGLKFYSASPECPHKDDPEHRRLTARNS